MKSVMVSWTLKRGVPCVDAAWDDLRQSQIGQGNEENFDCVLATAKSEEENFLRRLLRSAPERGIGFRAQCRIWHRLEPSSKVRLYKGLFNDIGRRTGAKTIEKAVNSNEVTLLGVWPLNDLTVKAATEGCADHSTCCFILSATPFDVEILLESLSSSVVTKGICSINYPDLADNVCSSGGIIVKASPKDHLSILLISRRGAMANLHEWIERAAR